MTLPDPTVGSGVYAIVCLVTGKRYIGSSRDIRTRARKHRGALRRGTHHSAHLQAAWNLYGEQQFVLEVIERCAPEHLLNREQCHLDTVKAYQPENGFNSATTTVNAGKTFASSDTAVANLRQYLAEHREERIIAAINRQGRSFRIQSPTGEIIEATGVRAFARKHGLSYNHLKNVLDGRIRWIDGWKLPETPGRPTSLRDSSGNVHVIVYSCLVPFCRENGLSPACIRRVNAGQQPTHRGWSRAEWPVQPNDLCALQIHS